MPTVKQALKSTLESDLGRCVIAWSAATYIRLVWLTGRWRFIGIEHRDALLNAEKGFILSFWHGRLLMLTHAWPIIRPVHIVISEHRDGELIAHTNQHFNIQCIKGSTSKGGAKALRHALSVLKRNEIVGITPDGPRGPRMRVTEGVIQLARLSGLPILPVAVGVRRGKLFSSWDRFLLPYPFTSGCFAFGDPMSVPRNATSNDIDAHRLQLEDAMNDLVVQVDDITGRTPVRPADPAPEVTA